MQEAKLVVYNLKFFTLLEHRHTLTLSEQSSFITLNSFDK